ncbi:hypothetical protein ETD83_39265 [Actinomadura soli]|uniref:Uncharacterized protein n=1 Tax=Actinomadura soli TaxID=2508997 RepID=A0A5C4IZ89_9ACTN|nr:hypothetical protein [Actinomadura soli]TMQ89157.1 hypothetical protein ETD83_39265 [Actinomadura soli]
MASAVPTFGCQRHRPEDRLDHGRVTTFGHARSATSPFAILAGFDSALSVPVGADLTLPRS